jgi:hypothetical protein
VATTHLRLLPTAPVTWLSLVGGASLVACVFLWHELAHVSPWLAILASLLAAAALVLSLIWGTLRALLKALRRRWRWGAFAPMAVAAGSLAFSMLLASVSAAERVDLLVHGRARTEVAQTLIEEHRHRLAHAPGSPAGAPSIRSLPPDSAYLSRTGRGAWSEHGDVALYVQADGALTVVFVLSWRIDWDPTEPPFYDVLIYTSGSAPPMPHTGGAFVREPYHISGSWYAALGYGLPFSRSGESRAP